MRKLLLLTYHFPPSAASGTFRMIGFCRHLPDAGWQPVVVAPPSLPWEPVDANLLRRVPEGTPVCRVPYPLGFGSRVIRRFARYSAWLVGAARACARAIHEHRPAALVTSGPPHCVHLLGLLLCRRYNLPWVADFRDLWLGDFDRPRQPLADLRDAVLERAVVGTANAVVANAPRACQVLQATYPRLAHKFHTITNGYAAEIFADLAPPSRDGGARRVLHTGELYTGRDPRPFLDALEQCRRESGGSALKAVFLGRDADAGFDFAEEIRRRGLDEVVDRVGHVPHRRVLEEMIKADILLLLDSPGRGHGVPAKLYEYIGAGRPILALTEPDGDVAAILGRSPVLHRIAQPGNVGAIGRALAELTQEISSGQGEAPPAELLFPFTQEAMARHLADLLEACATPQRDGFRTVPGTVRCVPSPRG